MSKPEHYEAVILDLDGTLVNTLADIAAGINYALKKLSPPTLTVDLFSSKVGTSNDELMSSCLAPDKQHLKDQAVEIQIEHYAQHFCDHSDADPGITDILRQLQSHGFRLAVLSNKPAPFAPRLVKHVFGDSFFEMVQGELPGVPLKPDPTSALDIAHEFALPTGRIAFVGDSATDMQTARNADMFAVGVTWGFRDRPELEQNGSEAIIDHPSALLPLLLTVE